MTRTMCEDPNCGYASLYADARAEVERLRLEKWAVTDGALQQVDRLEGERNRLGATAALLREAATAPTTRMGKHNQASCRFCNEYAATAESIPHKDGCALAADPDEWLRAHDAEVARNVRGECHGGLCLSCMSIQSEMITDAVEPYREALRRVVNNLGVPGNETPQPIAYAWGAAKEALGGAPQGEAGRAE